MLVIGLTGGIGSGKSTVASIFANLGIQVINADQLARDVVEHGSPALAAIVERYGENILLEDGSLNRSDLREIVFANVSEREWLEQLTHPLIAQLMKDQLQAVSSPYAILESPLLIETDQKELVDRILVIDIVEDTQLQRTLARDNSAETTIKAIINSQIPREQRLEAADDVVDNSGKLETTEQEILRLHKKYLLMANA
ncbi:MAG: dephospho-CoA kinase [Pseudomonadota bacterium]|nr:dephospho-CoA kinase [Pseudomonadota bacterium]